MIQLAEAKMGTDPVEKPEEELEEPTETLEDPKPKDKKKPKEQIFTFTKSKFDERIDQAKRSAVRDLADKFGLRSPDDLAALLDRANELEEREAERAEGERLKQEEEAKKRGQFEQIEARQKQRITDLENELKETNTKWSSRYSEKVIGDELAKLFLDNNGLPGAMGDAVTAMMRPSNAIIELSEGDDIIVKNSKGEIMLTEDGDRMGAGDYVKQFLRERRYFLNASKGRGTDTPPGVDVPDVPMSDVEKQKFIAEQTAAGKSAEEISKMLGLWQD